MARLYGLKIYKKAPIFIQNAFVTAKGTIHNKIREGKTFHNIKKELMQNETLTRDELQKFQFENLKKILNHAYNSVSFYRRLFDKTGFNPQNFMNTDDLKCLPLLEKKSILDHYDEFIPSYFRRKFLFKGTTTGTTGSPLSLYMNRKLIECERAFVERQYRWAGLSEGEKIAFFVGDIIVPIEQKAAPFWRYNTYSNEILFSTYHISESTLESYIQKLQKFEPKLISAYPSILFLLAKYASNDNLTISIPSLNGIIANSETLYEYQKKLIKKVFGVPIFNLYGHFERVVKIGTCEFNSNHVFPDYGFTEFIPVAGTDGKKFYELVGTGFINKVMPLIRYRTGDLVTLTDEPCACGRNFPRVESIMGRSNDSIITPEGRIIVMVDSVFKDIHHIKMAQIHQKNREELVVLVESESGFNSSDKEKIIDNMILRVGDSMKVSVKPVDKIPRLPRGKFKLIVSHLHN